MFNTYQKTATVFCRHCGNKVDENCAVCPSCGNRLKYPEQPQQEAFKKFCKYCGSSVDKQCVICPHCGGQIENININNPIPNIFSCNNNNINDENVKNKWISVLLCLFLGPLGAHKFYEDKIGIGILYLFTGGLFLIGVLVDLIKLLSKPGNTYYVK